MNCCLFLFIYSLLFPLSLSISHFTSFPLSVGKNRINLGKWKSPLFLTPSILYWIKEYTALHSSFFSLSWKAAVSSFPSVLISFLGFWFFFRCLSSLLDLLFSELVSSFFSFAFLWAKNWLQRITRVLRRSEKKREGRKRRNHTATVTGICSFLSFINAVCVTHWWMS